MQLVNLPSEIILAVFGYCSSIVDVTNFSQVCRRIYSVLATSQKTLVLYNAAELQFGPLHDVIQLLTLNSSQAASSIRDPPRSDALLRQIVVVGRIAKRWEELYPSLWWDLDFASRRLLSVRERFRMRRAFYRYWLYAQAFHTPMFPRTVRRIPQVVQQRMMMLQSWSHGELIEIFDFQASMRTLISTQICPIHHLPRASRLPGGVSSSISRGRESAMLTSHDYFHSARVTYDDISVDWDNLAGWDDSVTRYYLVEDLLKLNPEAILWLCDHPQKWQVTRYLDSLGEWFVNNGDTFSETFTEELYRRNPELTFEVDVGIVREAGMFFGD